MSEQFIKSLTTITYGIRDGRSISYDEFLNMPFLFPSQAEQQRIRECLKGFDDCLDKCQQRLEKLRQLKKAMLEKMFA